MTAQRRRSWRARLLRPVVLAAAVCLVVAGCGTTPDLGLGSPSAVRLLPSGLGSKAEAEVSREEVDADPFPRGPGKSR